MWKQAKQVAYIYDGNQNQPDVELDPDDEIPVPPKLAIIGRRGTTWEVVQVIEEQTVSAPKSWPVFKIFLKKIRDN